MVESFVDEVGFSCALVSELSGDAIESLANVGEVNCFGWSCFELGAEHLLEPLGFASGRGTAGAKFELLECAERALAVGAVLSQRR